MLSIFPSRAATLIPEKAAVATTADETIIELLRLLIVDVTYQSKE